jgi:predicted nucleic acid-binding protein
MSGRAAYLDTSAFVKLVVREPESEALARYLRQWPWRMSSALLRAEAIRAVGRHGQRPIAAARRLFGSMHLLALDDALLERAGEIQPWALRSLDAVHLATALAVGSDLGVVVTYDDRLADGAQAQGLDVARPR